jgi:hypothetical protein
MREERLSMIVDTRSRRPQAIAEAAAARRRPEGVLDESGHTLVIAADHPARGALGAGRAAHAMADRQELLDRLCEALSRPGVGGLLGTPDIVEDLLLLGALDGKAVYGSMNRGGLAGASFELDDRFTAYDAAAIARAGFEGGKMLLRIDADDPGSLATIEGCSRAVSELAERELVAMVEPFMCRRTEGRLRVELTPEAVIRSSAIAAGLGTTSAYTWLKLPVVEDMERVAAATTLPVLLLGGEVTADQDAAFERWGRALALPTVLGLVVGRSLLYPPDDDVGAAVDAAVGLLPRAVAR